MKKFTILIAVLLGVVSLSAQEDAYDQALYTTYHLNPVMINPAAAGVSGTHNLQLNLRGAWAGFGDGSPVTYGLRYNGPVSDVFALGGGIYSENIGGLNRFRFILDYAFKFRGENVDISAGLSTEFQNFRLASSIRDNPVYQPGDQLAEDYIDGQNLFDASLGVYGTFFENTFAGIAFPNLVLAKLGDIENNDPNGEFFRYVVFHAGHNFKFSDYDFVLTPSIMIRKFRNVPFQADFNLVGSFLQEKLITGLSFGTGPFGDLDLMLGTKINTVKIVYSYGVAFGDFQQYSSGGHEVLIGFEFGSGEGQILPRD